MRIEKVHLRRFCQHEDLEVEFSPGLNAVRGAIGSGKTNLLNALVFAVTGDLSRLHGVKTDNITQPLAAKKATVDVWLSHGAAQVQLSRSIPTGQSLKFVGDDKTEPLTRDSEISATLEKLLGVNQRLLLDYVFVPQWGIFAFIDDLPSVRAKAFSELFGASQAEQLYKIVGDHKIDIPAPSLAADQVKARLQENRDLLADSYKTLDGTYGQVPDEWNHEADPDYVLCGEWQKKDRLTTRHQQLTAESQKLHTQMVDAAALVQATTKTLDELQELADESKEIAESARADLKTWAMHEQVAQNKKRYYAALATTEKELRELTAPTKPADYVHGQTRIELEKRLFEINSCIHQINGFLANIQRGRGQAECPTCGTPSVQLDHLAAEFQTTVGELKPLATAMTVQLNRSKLYDQEEAGFSHLRTNLETRAKEIGVSLAGIEEVSPPTLSKEQTAQLVADYDAVLTAVSTKRTLRHSHDTQLATMRGQFQNLNKHIASVSRELGPLTVTREEADVALIRYNQRKAQVTERMMLKLRLQDLQRLIADDEVALVRCQEEMKKAETARRLVSHLDEVRTVCKDLPRVVAEHHFNEMRAKINKTLEEFNLPFRIHQFLEKELRFILKFTNGKLMPAERLSGGQRVLFALAVRIVVNSRFAQELGLLCLDEPTAGLDDDGLACLEIALGRLRELSQARGLQVILITHDAGLDGLFDRVIKLQSAS